MLHFGHGGGVVPRGKRRPVGEQAVLGRDAVFGEDPGPFRAARARTAHAVPLPQQSHGEVDVAHHEALLHLCSATAARAMGTGGLGGISIRSLHAGRMCSSKRTFPTIRPSVSHMVVYATRRLCAGCRDDPGGRGNRGHSDLWAGLRRDPEVPVPDGSGHARPDRPQGVLTVNESHLVATTRQGGDACAGSRRDPEVPFPDRLSGALRPYL